MGSTTGPRRCQPPQTGRSGTKVIGHTIFKMHMLLGINGSQKINVILSRRLCRKNVPSSNRIFAHRFLSNTNKWIYRIRTRV